MTIPATQPRSTGPPAGTELPAVGLVFITMGIARLSV
jgi:hypothetical protein